MFKRWTSKSKRSVDLSFLNQEEVNAVLEVLERDKEVRRMNSERLKEVKKTNPNKLWLKGVTGEWFEDLKKSKFNNQTDLSKLLKVSRTWQSGKHNQPDRSKDQFPEFGELLTRLLFTEDMLFVAFFRLYPEI